LRPSGVEPLIDGRLRFTERRLVGCPSLVVSAERNVGVSELFGIASRKRCVFLPLEQTQDFFRLSLVQQNLREACPRNVLEMIEPVHRQQLV
jgi:hypothetical protein